MRSDQWNDAVLRGDRPNHLALPLSEGRVKQENSLEPAAVSAFRLGHRVQLPENVSSCSTTQSLHKGVSGFYLLHAPLSHALMVYWKTKQVLLCPVGTSNLMKLAGVAALEAAFFQSLLRSIVAVKKRQKMRSHSLLLSFRLNRMTLQCRFKEQFKNTLRSRWK